MRLTEGEAGEGEIGVLSGGPATSERYAKDNGAVDEGRAGFDEGRAKVESSEEVDRDQLQEASGALEGPDGDGSPYPCTNGNYVVEESGKDEDSACLGGRS